MHNKLLTLLLLGIMGVIQNTAAAGTSGENAPAARGEADGLAPGITQGMEREYRRDFLRPEFEHERQRGFDHDNRQRYREGLQQDREHAAPQADPGLERAWEGLDNERRRGLYER